MKYTLAEKVKFFVQGVAFCAHSCAEGVYEFLLVCERKLRMRHVIQGVKFRYLVRKGKFFSFESLSVFLFRIALKATETLTALVRTIVGAFNSIFSFFHLSTSFFRILLS